MPTARWKLAHSVPREPTHSVTWPRFAKEASIKVVEVVEVVELDAQEDAQEEEDAQEDAQEASMEEEDTQEEASMEMVVDNMEAVEDWVRLRRSRCHRRS